MNGWLIALLVLTAFLAFGGWVTLFRWSFDDVDDDEGVVTLPLIGVGGLGLFLFGIVGFDLSLGQSLLLGLLAPAVAAEVGLLCVVLLMEWL